MASGKRHIEMSMKMNNQSGMSAKENHGGHRKWRWLAARKRNVAGGEEAAAARRHVGLTYQRGGEIGVATWRLSWRGGGSEIVALSLEAAKSLHPAASAAWLAMKAAWRNGVAAAISWHRIE
jgi:hypothetical protein